MHSSSLPAVVLWWRAGGAMGTKVWRTVWQTCGSTGALEWHRTEAVSSSPPQTAWPTSWSPSSGGTTGWSGGRRVWGGQLLACKAPSGSKGASRRRIGGLSAGAECWRTCPAESGTCCTGCPYLWSGGCPYLWSGGCPYLWSGGWGGQRCPTGRTMQGWGWRVF